MASRAARPHVLLLVVLTAFTLVVSALMGPPAQAASASAQASSRSLESFNDARPVRVVLPDAATLHDLEDRGYDLAHDVAATDSGAVEVTAFVTDWQLERLRAVGVRPARRAAAAAAAAPQARARTSLQAQSAEVAQAPEDELGVNILRADWFTNYSGTFINVEAKVGVDDPEVAEDLVVIAHVGDQEFELNDFEDADVYMYHRTRSPEPIDAPPDTPVVVTVQESEDGPVLGSDTQEFEEWIPGGVVDDPRYEEGFHDQYLDAVQITNKIEQLAAEFPELTELITLPYETNGYQRKAQVLLYNEDVAETDPEEIEDDEEDEGELNTSNEAQTAFYATTHAWGHEGGNDWTIELVDPDTANSGLTVDAEGTAITVTLATDAEGDITTTAADVVAALNAELSDVLTAHTFRGLEGSGIVAPGSDQFSDFLTAPEHVERGPAEVKMLRIGRDLDGSNVGVLAYSQEHAREWQTPLVSLETAERLLRNYRRDHETRRLVNNLDIFIIPTVNPDGTNYSMYDYAFQRKNMTNYCGPELSDPLARNAWGVDLNRNHSVGSAHDGYDGASTTNCVSGVYAGPHEYSEPEARNLKWVAETFDNIKFSMNIHSHGGYFMWSPGAYIEDGRIPLPRPSLGVENYFWEASKRVLEAIKGHRGTVIHPGRTGPVIDVLYSAAGNSADELYYNHDIIAWNFEVGASIWDEEEQDWETPDGLPGNADGFQPAFPEAKHQAMEFSDGLIEMLQLALDYSRDRRAPRSDLVVVDRGEDYVEFTFTTSEPATVYYTLDGSRPTFESETLEAEYIRDDAETIRVPEGTEVRYFSVDIAGNVERHYDPTSPARNYRRGRINDRIGGRR